MGSDWNKEEEDISKTVADNSCNSLIGTQECTSARVSEHMGYKYGECTSGVLSQLALDAGTTDAVPAGTVDDAPRSWLHGTSHAMDHAIGPTVHAISRALLAAECTS
jgi:hypothetical protein